MFVNPSTSYTIVDELDDVNHKKHICTCLQNFSEYYGVLCTDT